jgi:uncharacterized protein (TIGR02246 family)
MFRSLLGAVVVAGMAACAPQEAPVAAAPAVDTAAVVAGVADLWARWQVADTANDVQSLGAMATEDARFDVKGMPPLVGRAAILEVMTPMYAQIDYLEATVSPTTTIPVTNDLAHQAGTWMERYTVKGEKGEKVDYGRYISAMVRGPDGQWRWAYYMGFADSTVTKK